MVSNKRLWGSLLSLTALAGSFAACGKIVDTAAALEATKVSMTQAIKAARATIEDGVPLEVELEMVGDKPRYNVELATKDKVSLVVVDGVSGEVIETTEVIPDAEEKRIIDDLLALDAEQRLGLIGALKKATSMTDKGRPIEVDLEDANGDLVYSIRLVVGNLIERQLVNVVQE